jgi:CAAX protease family protein
VVLFGGLHAYQGWGGVIRTGVFGALYTAIVGFTESLWPAIVLHTLVDGFSGVMAWLVLRDARA